MLVPMIFVRPDPNVTLMGAGLGAASRLAVGGNTAVQRLQQSLQQLAVAVNHPTIAPGRDDGIVDTQTMLALAQGFNLLAEKLPWEARYALQAALLAGSFTPQVTGLVKAYADILNVAAQAAIMKYAQTPNVPTPPNLGPLPAGYPTGANVPPPPPALVPWYKTTGGAIGIGVGVLGGIALLAFVLK